MQTEFKPGNVLIIDADRVIGPFPDCFTAGCWLGQHSVQPGYRVISLHAYAEPGTEDHAHHCGTIVRSED